MKIKRLHIKNYKSIKELEIDDAQGCNFILVGRNNSGKSVILDAIRVALGDKQLICRILRPEGNIIIGMELEFAYEDLSFLHGNGIVKK